MESKVRNYQELGINLQKIVSRLMANNNLVNLLYYQNNDPLNTEVNPVLTDAQKKSEIFNKRIKLVPKIDPQENVQSTISVIAASSTSLGGNDEFNIITIVIMIYVPLSQWIIKDSNLRPYAIMGEIQNSLNGKIINGLGQITGGDFDYDKSTDDMTIFSQVYKITNYD